LRKYSLLFIGLAFACTGKPVQVQADPLEEKKPVPVIAGFALTPEDLEGAISGFERLDKAAVTADPEDFLTLISNIMSDDDALFHLVDKEHSLGESFVPTDLVELSAMDIVVNRAGMQLRKEPAEALEAMCRAAAAEGITLDISSAYRSYSYQDALFQNSIKRIGEEATRRELAVPGTSQHQLGSTIDFGTVDERFAKTKAYAWLQKNAGKYGFVISYPEDDEEFTGYIFESWHYRYLTVSGANLCEKYFNGSQQAMMLFLHNQTSWFMMRRHLK